MSKKIALILARSGSKGLKNKNMMFLIDKPLMFYTIDAALKSNIFDKIIVSTDSEEYINNSKLFYDVYNVDFQIRPKIYSKDTTNTYETIKYILEENKFDDKDIICLLQPTSPLRDEKHIVEAFKKYKKNHSVISICKNKKSPILNMEVKNNILYFNNSLSNYNRNKEPNYFIPNGAIYIIDVLSYLNNKTFFIEDRTIPYEMSYINSIDIDDIDDFNIVLWYLRTKMEADYKKQLENKIKNHNDNNSIALGDSLIFNITSGLNFSGIENFGFPGISSTELSKLLKSSNININCRNLFVLLGTNDIVKDKKINLIKNIEEIKKKINFKKFYIIEIPMTLYRNDRDNDKIYNINLMLRKKYKDDFINVNHILSTNNKLNIEFTSDGLHLNDIGNQKLKQLITNKNK